VNKAICTGRADRLLVETLSIELAAFDPGDALAPTSATRFSKFSGQSVPRSSAGCGGFLSLRNAAVLIGRREIPGCRVGKRAIEAKLHVSGCDGDLPEQPFAPSTRHPWPPYSRRKIARLQFPDPVPARGYRPACGCWINGVPSRAHPYLIIEAAELRGQAAERRMSASCVVTMSMTCRSVPSSKTRKNPRLHAARSTSLFPRREKITEKLATAISRPGKVTHFVRASKARRMRSRTGPDMSRPGMMMFPKTA